MNRSAFALFVALLIHLVLLLTFVFLGVNTSKIKKHEKEEKKVKISLKELPKKMSAQTKKIVKPTPIAPPMPKGKQLKKIVKSKKQVQNKKPIVKKRVVKKTKRVLQPKQKPQVSKRPPKRPFIPVVDAKVDVNKTKKVKKTKKLKNSMSWMYEDKSEEVETKQTIKSSLGSNISQNIKQLYGSEWGKLTKGQQEYVLDNQEVMRRITQEVLTRVASVNLPLDMSVNRSNIIEFYLHPNGDMTDFKFLQKSGYFVLDDTTKETISYAYSRYPRPKEKILIRYNVFYNLARY